MTRAATLGSAFLISLTALLAMPRESRAEPKKQECPPDSVRSGTVCIDKYEASVWRTTNAQLIKKIRQGTVTLRELRAGGAVQVGVEEANYGCDFNGSGCLDIYAVSLHGVEPSGFPTWFQAAAAARNAWKRLPTNAEWQAAALGTPDETDDGATTCNTAETGTWQRTGSRSACMSDVGAYDMAGNLFEWVADWVPGSTGCGRWSFTDDSQCLAGAGVEEAPGALIRGGGVGDGSAAGPYAILGIYPPNVDPARSFGFRAVR